MQRQHSLPVRLAVAEQRGATHLFLQCVCNAGGFGGGRFVTTAVRIPGFFGLVPATHVTFTAAGVFLVRAIYLYLEDYRLAQVFPGRPCPSPLIPLRPRPQCTGPDRLAVRVPL